MRMAVVVAASLDLHLAAVSSVSEDFRRIYDASHAELTSRIKY